MDSMGELRAARSRAGVSGDRRALSVADLEAYLDQDASRFFYRWGGLLSAALVRIRARFQGDLDQYLIYLVFLLDDLAQVISAQSRGSRRQETEVRGLNALSIAEVTSIPRETARRKLQLLVACGYIERGADGLYYLGDRYGLDQFFYDLSPLFWEGVKPERAASAETVEPEPELPDR